MSLRTRVTLAALAAVTITLGGVGTLVVESFASRERDALDRRLEQALGPADGRAGRRPAAARAGGDARTSRPRRGARGARLQRAALRAGVGIVAVSRDGEPPRRFGLAADDTELAPRTAASPPTDVEIDGTGYRRLSRAVAATSALPATVLTAYAPRGPTESRIDELRSRVLVLGAIGLGLAVLLASAFSQIALRRLDGLRHEAEAVTLPQDGRLTGGGPREVDDLAGSLNAMLDRLAEAYRERDAALEASRRFAADAGHELRTPLATMRTDLRTLRDHGGLNGPAVGLVRSLEHEQHRLGDLLAALQALARGDAGVAADDRDVVDLGQVLDAALEAFSARHRDARVRGPDRAGILLSASEVGLRLAVDNLLENAARHGGPQVAVTVAVHVDDAMIVVTVSDDGPGVPAVERERVLRRFARGTGARGPGSGLGLALVAQQATLHGGSFELRESAEGGLEAVLRLARGALEPDR